MARAWLLCAAIGDSAGNAGQGLAIPTTSILIAADVALNAMVSRQRRAVSREFSIREGYRFEVRADAFNLPNSFRAGVSPPSMQAGGSGVNTTFGTPTFGQITSALDPRILQLAMKFSF